MHKIMFTTQANRIIDKIITNTFIQTGLMEKENTSPFGKTEKAIKTRDKTKIAHSFKTRAKFVAIRKKAVKSGKKVWMVLSKSVKNSHRL